jgi:hypothetical protein
MALSRMTARFDDCSMNSHSQIRQQPDYPMALWILACAAGGSLVGALIGGDPAIWIGMGVGAGTGVALGAAMSADRHRQDEEERNR